MSARVLIEFVILDALIYISFNENEEGFLFNNKDLPDHISNINLLNWYRL